MTQVVDLRHREMLDMIPRFYDDAPEADGILYADAVEIERVRADARDLMAQLSATTATWGLSDWERVLELPPRPNSPEDLRRARILAKLRGTAPATIDNMLAIVNAHVPLKNATLTELPQPGVVIFNVPAQDGVNFTEMYADIHTYKPAHLQTTLTDEIKSLTKIASFATSGDIVTIYPKPMTEDISASARASVYSYVKMSTKITLEAIYEDKVYHEVKRSYYSYVKTSSRATYEI